MDSIERQVIMKYKITYIANSEYCNLKPSDSDCQRSVNVIANTKTEAIMELHEQFDMIPVRGRICQPTNIFPMVWTVENLT